MTKKHRKFMEDDFDLDLYIKEQSDKTIIKKIQEQSRKLSGIVKILLIVASFITAYTLYSYASYLIEVWRDNRINETARDITEQASVLETPYVPETQINIISQGVNKQSRVILTPTPILMPAIIDLRDAFQNDDICAYLKIEGCNIDFPVVKSDDNTYYLTHDLRGQKNAAGSAFLDYENEIYPLGFNTVVYAHNMRDGSMFHNLRYYKEADYFETHKKISLQTLHEDTLWEIFSFYETDISFLYNTTTFNSTDDFIIFANLVKEKSQYPSDIIFTEDSRILTLSTCTNHNADSRYVAHAYRIK